MNKPTIIHDPSNLIAHIIRINLWLDTSNHNDKHEDAMRIMKIGEEYGETVQAYIGMTGQNPRKGIINTQDDMMFELADIVITALCAMAHFVSKSQDNYIHETISGYLMSKINTIMTRAEIGDDNI